ncbi:MAG TPA: methyltransferase domain-containing protein, partial [Burkholderiales bacterium]|nr:methyltransferase domain-containing protein [Burkholderiales bacterium]
MDRWLDRAAARRGFEATSGPDVLAREVENRLAERLQYIKLEPQRIVDAGCGASSATLHLRQRYPDAVIHGVDSSFNALRHARAPANWLGRLRGVFHSPREHWVAADMTHLPFAPGSCDLLWSNLSLAWADDPLACFKEWQRALRVGGLVMFTTYGPDTLKELRSAFGEDPFPHVHPFIDMHDLGDMMVASGFAEPVMDMEMLTLTYSNVPAMLGELRATGQVNAHRGRRRALTAKGRWAQMTTRYAAMAREGRIPATFEIVYGHAWKPAPREIADG